MSEFLSIGKVSKQKNISIKSLRYYDEIGILKPAFVNKQTNYRYYTENQLFVLDAISLCLQLGIPLKDLHHYAKEDHLDLQKLLYDGKALAEEKILDIRGCLETLQNTLSKMEAAPQKSSYDVIKLAEQFLICLPLDEYTTPKYYGQYILKLFVTSQQFGFTGAYPSGIIHEYTTDKITRYMYLHLQTLNGQPLTKEMYFEWCHLHPDEAHYLRYFPACTCKRVLLKEHIEGNAIDFIKEKPASLDSLILLENDIIDEKLKESGFPLELLELTTSP